MADQEEPCHGSLFLAAASLALSPPHLCPGAGCFLKVLRIHLAIDKGHRLPWTLPVVLGCCTSQNAFDTPPRHPPHNCRQNIKRQQQGSQPVLETKERVWVNISRRSLGTTRDDCSLLLQFRCLPRFQDTPFHKFQGSSLKTSGDFL